MEKNLKDQFIRAVAALLLVFLFSDRLLGTAMECNNPETCYEPRPIPEKPNPEEKCKCDGMPFFWVSEPSISVWLRDIPLRHQASVGPEIKLDLTFCHQRRGELPLPSGKQSYGFGDGWRTWFHQCIKVDLTPGTPDADTKNLTVWHWDGVTGKVQLNPAGGAYTGTLRDKGTTVRRLMEIVPPGTPPIHVGYEVVDQLGGTNRFATKIGSDVFFLSSVSDSRGNTITFVYDPSEAASGNVKLVQVQDARNGTVVFSYDGPGEFQVKTVTSSLVGSVHLKYTGTKLESIVDVAAIRSSFQYLGSGKLESFSTPYGKTSFAYSFSAETDGDVYKPRESRWVKVSHADNSYELFAAFDGPENSNYDAAFNPSMTGVLSQLNSGATQAQDLLFDGSDLRYRNTFHWSRKVFADITTANPVNMTTADLLKARTRHWLVETPGGFVPISRSSYASYARLPGTILSWEREASIDGLKAGPVTFYGYYNRIPIWAPDGVSSIPYGNYTPSSSRPGTNSEANLVIRLQPDNSTWWQVIKRNALENETEIVDHWKLPASEGGAYTSQTVTRGYDTAGRKLLTVVGPDTKTKLTVEYSNSAIPELPTAVKNGLSHTTLLGWLPDGRIDWVQDPVGYRKEFAYASDGTLSAVVEKESATSVLRSTSFSWQRGIDEVRTYPSPWNITVTNRVTKVTVTQPSGLVTTTTFDGLQRPLERATPYDSTTEKFIYAIAPGTSYPNSSGSPYLLKATGFKNRLDQYHQFSWDSMVQMKEHLTPRLTKTVYDYCSCGSLDSIARGAGSPEMETTFFDRHLNGLLSFVTLPDSRQVRYGYDSNNRRTSVTNGLGVVWRIYDNLDRIREVGADQHAGQQHPARRPGEV